MPLTKLQEEVYLANRGVKCPVCQSEDIVGGSIDIDAGFASQTVDCSNCNAVWNNMYTLTGVELIYEGDGEAKDEDEEHVDQAVALLTSNTEEPCLSTTGAIGTMASSATSTMKYIPVPWK